MGIKVLKCDSAGGDAFLSKTFSPDVTTPWSITFDVMVPQSTLDAIDAHIPGVSFAFTADFIEIANETDGVFWTSRPTNGAGGGFATTIAWWTDFAPTAPQGSPTADTWHTVRIDYDGTNVEWTLDGVLLFTDVLSLSLNNVELGSIFSNGIAGEIYYIDNFTVKQGASVVFCDDFESGNFSLWTSTTGTVSIVDDPLATGGSSPDCGGGGVLTANFSGTPTSGSLPLSVDFTDLSSPGPGGPISGWAWDFGDGGTSTAQNPTHIYTAAGIYTISLTITSPDGTATRTRTDYITAGRAITFTPTQALPGDSVSISGFGFAPFSPLTATFNGNPITLTGTTVTDSQGAFTGALFVVPALPTGRYEVVVSDGSGNMASGFFNICAPLLADSVDTTIPPICGPTWSAAIADNHGQPLSYIHHGSDHFICHQWITPAIFDHETFPPPVGDYHSLIIERVPDDCSNTHTTYLIDTDFHYGFDFGFSSFLGDNEWIVTIHWINWDMAVIDAAFASDGTDLWLAVLAREEEVYPYLSTTDGHGVGPGYPSQAEQLVDPLIPNGVDFTRFVHSTPILGTPAPPDSDGGDGYSGHWAPVRLIMFHFNGAGFDRVDKIDGVLNRFASDDATSGILDGGGFVSSLSVAASPAETGVCHVLWSEGGRWGTKGQSGTVPGHIYEMDDQSAPNQAYRLNYSKWSPGGIVGNVDQLYETQYLAPAYAETWLSDPYMVATGLHALRNDHGSPVAFVAKQLVSFDAGRASPNKYLPDNAEPTIRMWDMSTVAMNAPNELQAITVDLLPTATEIANQIPTPDAPAVPSRLSFEWPTNPGTIPPRYTPRLISAATLNGGRGFCVSSAYSDPTLSATPVYLLGVQWLSPGAGHLGNPLYARGFYRVPCSGSSPFSVLDGSRFVAILPNESVQVFATLPDYVPSLADFFSEPRNVWIPTYTGDVNNRFLWQLDRICCKCWQADVLGNFGAEPGAFLQRFDFLNPPYYDSAADIFYYAAEFRGASNVWGVGQTKPCRMCVTCGCAESVGLHIYDRITFG